MRNYTGGLVLALLAGTAPGVAADTIKLTGGKKPITNVDVLDETLSEVKYRQPRIRQAQSQDADNVVEVVYSDVPEDYTIAQENFDAGAFGAAATLFRAAAADSKRKAGLEAKARYMAGEALRLGGMGQDAVKAFDDAIAKHPESRYTPYAVLGRAITLSRMGDASRARTGFNKLKSYGGRWDYESQLQLLILDEAKDPSGAFDAYKRLLGSTERQYPSVANQAKLRIGRALIRSGKYGEAQRYFETILDNRSDSSSEVVAGAFNGLGASLWNKPNASADDFKQALYAHLRVYVSYPEVIEEQPEAMYSIGKCFQQVPGPDSAARATHFLRNCAARYPDTEWGQKAMGG